MIIASAVRDENFVKMTTFQIQCLCEALTYPTQPTSTKRNKPVIITSKRRFDVIITCLLRKWYLLMPFKLTRVFVHAFPFPRNALLYLIIIISSSSSSSSSYCNNNNSSNNSSSNNIIIITIIIVIIIIIKTTTTTNVMKQTRLFGRFITGKLNYNHFPVFKPLSQEFPHKSPVRKNKLCVFCVFKIWHFPLIFVAVIEIHIIQWEL